MEFLGENDMSRALRYSPPVTFTSARVLFCGHFFVCEKLSSKNYLTNYPSAVE